MVPTDPASVEGMTEGYEPRRAIASVVGPTGTGPVETCGFTSRISLQSCSHRHSVESVVATEFFPCILVSATNRNRSAW